MGFGGGGSRYHNGDDWVLARLSSFGAPVHSIGHGRITYAEPRGWGADKGVVIVRHTFSDGSTILSFYGHLDPASVVLKPGDCVARGDQVGTIGRPRTPPHLHFEIRSHTPTEPGRGYLSVDPTSAGWEPPSQYIWNTRIATLPGLRWMRPLSTKSTRILGSLSRDTLVAVEDHDLIGINLLDGSLRWRQPGSDAPADAMISANRSFIYVIDGSAQLEAFRLLDAQDSRSSTISQPSIASMWKMELDMIRSPTLMPLPGGGVVVSGRRMVYSMSDGHSDLSGRRRMLGLSAEGRQLWEIDVPAPIDWEPGDDHWALTHDQLVFTTSGGDAHVWTVDESGPIAWAMQVSGRPVFTGDSLFVYDQEGIYRLDPEARSVELLYALPEAYPGLGDVAVLPDKGLVVAHSDRYDRRLIALNSDGSLRWERSYSNVTPGQPRLLTLGSQPYILLQNDTASASRIAIFAIDMDRSRLNRIASVGGPPAPRSEDTSAFVIDGHRILINIAAGSMIVLDTQLAEAVVETRQ
jgi:hypothetical protein